MASSSSSSSSISSAAATMISSSSITTTSFILLLLSFITEVAAFTTPVSHTTAALSSAISTASSPRYHSRSSVVTLFAEEGKSDRSSSGGGGTTLFFASDSADEEESAALTDETADNKNNELKKKVTLFNEETIAEANDALTSVGWAGVAPTVATGEEGEMTSDDPFVQQIDESIMKEMGVGLDQLLNPAKVVNLERDLYNLRTELASLTGAKLTSSTDNNNSFTLTTSIADGGGGGDEADAIRTKISKKEKDLALERRSVFRGWLKNVFLGQALFSMILSYVMATNPDVLFGNFNWYNNVSNMDTSIKVLGFWWWWLFIVPSLRSRRPTGLEKKALDIAFLGTPLISLLSPVVTKDTGLIWVANFMVVAGAYGFAFTVGNDENDQEDDDGGEEGGGSKKDPAWLKFIYKSLDFGSGRERGARR